jgi:hypothetical protein
MSRRRLLQERVHNLSPTEHNEIFKILSKHDAQFTKNSNGCFFNLVHVSDDVISEIETFVRYCLENEQKIDDYNKLLNTYKAGGTLKVKEVLEDTPPPPPSLPKKGGSKKKKKDEAAVVVEADEDNSSSIFSDGDSSEDDFDEPVEEVVAVDTAQQLTQEKQMELRRKALSKFVVARKKFAKRHVQDKKIEITEADFLWSKE